MKRAESEVGAAVISTMMHQFKPQGVTGIILLSEYHCSIHAWLESGHASVDFCTCGNKCLPEKSLNIFRHGLMASDYKQLIVSRGESLEVLSDSKSRASL